ncbi:cytochrome P450 4C1-like isoform X2 [Pseudomyrmex gracilis]|uniref:cytochrome P450 4C1-like isoform X2 n=1 Tax=Pseudomyrmex gracilis TaxID=219809 RepID=UPI00099539DA|nr:cytochrome P450 4C1-like isoform X2 [Pseudomyrmex gracilis]
MIETIILFLIVFTIMYDFYLHHTRNGRLIDLIPGPPSIPVLGSAHFGQVSQEDAWHLIRFYTDCKYPIAKIWLGFTYAVSIRHPDDLEKVLSSTKHFEKSRIYDALRPWLNDGLLTSNGSKWHTRRKLLTPTFHFTILRQFIDVLIEEGNHMITSLKECEGTVIKDLVPFLSEHTLNAICETAMGISLRSCDTFQEQYRKSIEDMGNFIVYRIQSPWLYPEWSFALSPTGRQQAKALKILHGFTEKVIKERKLYHERTQNQYLKNIETGISTEIDDVEVIGIRKKRLAMLDLLIAASRENNITDLDIREEVDTFMFEGHDTTAMGVCFALLLLAEHKDVQDRVRTEVVDVMKETEGKLTMASLQKLPYLERCLKEVMRLYPSVHFISRRNTEEIQCQSYTIPVDTILHLNIYGVHRDANFWPNPEVFDPDRFLPEQMQNRHPYCYLPFSAGPRNCIGQRFAMYEMKAIVAPLVHHFYLEPVDYLKNLKIKIDLILRPAHPVRVKFVPIK